MPHKNSRETQENRARTFAKLLAEHRPNLREVTLALCFTQLFDSCPQGKLWSVFLSAYRDAAARAARELRITLMLSNTPEIPSNFERQGSICLAYQSSGKTLELVDSFTDQP